MTSATKTYGVFNKTKYRNTDVVTVTRKFFTRADARNYKASTAKPENVGIVNLTTGTVVR